MNKELVKWLLFICGFFGICFLFEIKFGMAVFAFLACLLGGWAYGKQQDKIAKKVADEIERRQREEK